jgi:hypothetical protein
MVDFKRTADRAGVIGTVTFHIVLLLLLMIMGKACTDVQADDGDEGGVTVSMGEPDMGGPDNETAKQEEYTPPQEEVYTPENQVTSDVDEAPEVQETKPVVKPTPKPKPTPTPSTTTTPTPTPTPTPKPPTPNIGKGKTGGGSGDGTTPGQKGNSTDGDGPDMAGIGGSGGGFGDLGNGISGKGFGGFAVRDIVKPASGSASTGRVVVTACLDARGKVISVEKSTERIGGNQSFDPDLLARAMEAMRKSTFTNTSNSKGACGDIIFTFKLN